MRITTYGSGWNKDFAFHYTENQTAKKRSAQTPCVVSDCKSGYRESKNLMLVKRPPLPAPASGPFGQGLAPELQPQPLSPQYREPA